MSELLRGSTELAAIAVNAVPAERPLPYSEARAAKNYQEAVALFRYLDELPADRQV